jgi:peptide deformylase
MLHVRRYGDPVLREVAVSVERVDGHICELADEMLGIMRDGNGIGLAAEQVGRTEAICVVHLPAELDMDKHGVRMNPGINMPLILINPEITRFSEERLSGEEGCLSLPGISLMVTRAESIDVKYLDRKGVGNEISVCGMLGRCIQHEVDHLKGLLIIDHVSKMKRMSISGRLKRLKQETRAVLNQKYGM